jgi:predicted nuclease of restriction endonuclease-like (RecB) superfamily
MTEETQDFGALVELIGKVHDESAAIVNRTVNTTLTLRNWVIGHYIDRYELVGLDRAKYGAGVISALAEALTDRGLTRCDRRELNRYLRFRRAYPQILESATPLLKLGVPRASIGETLSPPLSSSGDLYPSAIGESPSPQSGLSGERLLRSLSFSHFAELLEIEEPLKRAFYEIECIRGGWSVRALQRQIATLYFERSAWSADKELLSQMTHAAVERAEPRLAIRDPYVFEFIGLRAEDAVSESQLEAALIRHLHDFLLELGHGFCLEARQKSIMIGSTRGFVDLVFYHRVLKCHVLIDLKIDKFTHENFGQLNTYVNWYRQHMMTEGDNPPIGLLLCTQKDNALVQYATANVANDIFVSKYQVALPTPDELERFLAAKRRELTGGGEV